MKPPVGLGVSLALASLVVGCTNETTPEGYEGYVHHIPLVFGEAYFVGTQTGPTSTGLVWRQYVTNVDIRPKNYDEEFRILSRDNLNVGFVTHVRVGVRPGSVRRLVESFGTDEPVDASSTLPGWYVRAVRQSYRATVLDVVHKYNAYDIQARTQEISIQILERVKQRFDRTPVEFETISIGNLAYPDEINAEIQRKLAAEQDLERMDRERQIALQEAQMMVTTARGRAAAQRIVNETLTPLYVQHEMLESFRRLSRSDRVTIVASPTSEGSASPVILGLGNP